MNTQERADRLVRNEVYVCLSSLVATLAKGSGWETDADLSDLIDQAIDLCAPVLDYEEAARQAGWKTTKERHGDNEESVCSDDGGWAPDWQRACEDFGIEPYEREIFEHWSISQHLADDLIALGERVDTDFANMCVWGRTTTGQGIAQDDIIRRVLEMHDERLKAFEKEESAA